MTDLRDKTIARAVAFFDDGRFQRELAALVACPSESQHARGAAHLLSYLDDVLRPLLEALGFAVQIHAAHGARPPILTAERIEAPDLPTILTYGHGDVVLGQHDLWRAGLSPFTLTEEGDRLYGRGAADNKGQHLVNLLALEAVIETRGALGFNLKILIETGEETGSPGLKDFCRDNRALLAADVLIASDGPRLRPETVTVFGGSRGGVSFDLRVDLRDGAHHSGNFGGLLADPAMILAHALSCITDARGQIQVPEWRPDSLTPRIREVLAELPPHDTGVPLDPDWGEKALSAAERVFGWNSFAILAMISGVPDAPLNAIAGWARATCQLRYVIGTDVDDILPALRRHLDRAGFAQVQIVAHDHNTFPATRMDPDHPMVRYVARSVERTTGAWPHVLPNLGGSLPNDCFSEVLGLPTIWIPHSYAGCSQHAPNEHVLKPICRQALGVMAGVFADIAETGLPDFGTEAA
ncbi:M20 family metallopeptidase [Mesobacterium sp. TK19101]|uniref:M20 family metallopeptidase n=1 Tax=Mesobacterium hydrothermale TaxID=3111907 RepID=A0ABU6HFM4_9RHOB|nr:M20 family metallopeptidase [Mesobacterium sp. TK19101]MEC3861255.1 M20 family metallopeptidase [Mesobacterium sp. TK19101]